MVSAIWIEIKRQKHQIEIDIENVNMDVQTGLILKEDGRHKAVLTIIVICSLPRKRFVCKGFTWKYNGTHQVLKRIIVIRLLPNEQFDFVNENNMKLRRFQDDIYLHNKTTRCYRLT